MNRIEIELSKIADSGLVDYIQRQQCPFCDTKKRFTVLAKHVAHVHGISAYEFREMAGLNRGTSICDREFSEKMSEIGKNKSPEHMRVFVAAGHRPEVLAKREMTFRPEGKANRLAYLLSPERIKVSISQMNTPEANAKAKIKAQNRSPEIVEAQTKRVQKAHGRFLATHTSEEIAETRARAYATWVKRASEDMNKISPHEAQLKAAAAAAIAIPFYHADPVWRDKWRRNMEIGNQKSAKVSHGLFGEIARRYWSGESPTIIAAEYSISRAWVRKIAKKMVGIT